MLAHLSYTNEIVFTRNRDPANIFEFNLTVKSINVIKLRFLENKWLIKCIIHNENCNFNVIIERV